MSETVELGHYEEQYQCFFRVIHFCEEVNQS